MVKALCYKPEGRCFDPSWCQWIFYWHKILWYHHTYMCDDTRGCVMQFWPPDDKHMCSKHVEAWNKTYCETKILCMKLVNYWDKSLSHVPSVFPSFVCFLSPPPFFPPFVFCNYISIIYKYMWQHLSYNTQGEVTVLGAGKSRNHISILGMNKIFFLIDPNCSSSLEEGGFPRRECDWDNLMS